MQSNNWKVTTRQGGTNHVILLLHQSECFSLSVYIAGVGTLFMSALRNSLSHNSSLGTAHTNTAFVGGGKKCYFCRKMQALFTHRRVSAVAFCLPLDVRPILLWFFLSPPYSCVDLKRRQLGITMRWLCFLPSHQRAPHCARARALTIGWKRSFSCTVYKWCYLPPTFLAPSPPHLSHPSSNF